MQVFVPYLEPILSAQALFGDPPRFNKQIVECRQILAAISGRSDAWKNHPAVLQYKQHSLYVHYYLNCLVEFKKGDRVMAQVYSDLAVATAPQFLDQEFCDQHKRRLFAKSPSKYPQFSPYGPSDQNWYFVNGTLRKYAAGKRLE